MDGGAVAGRLRRRQPDRPGRRDHAGVALRGAAAARRDLYPPDPGHTAAVHPVRLLLRPVDLRAAGPRLDRCDPGVLDLRRRSEEHTSELQSLMRISYAVFFLKKNTIILH